MAAAFPEHGQRGLLRRLRAEFANWYVLGPLSWVLAPSRCPPRKGFAPLSRSSVTVRIRDGYRAQCRLDEFVGFVEVFGRGTYDVPEVRWAELRSIVDVGANVGAATLWFARRAPHARIVAVEPSSRASAVLMRNIRANGLETRVELVAAALTQRTGSVELEDSGASVHARISPGDSGHGERVSALSLEELLDRCGLEEIDLLKLDCEGAEFGVLMSSDDRLLRRIGVIVGEYHLGEHHQAGWADLRTLLGHLESAGFRTRVSGGHPLGLFQAVRG